jgi:hypothetical protein
VRAQGRGAESWAWGHGASPSATHVEVWVRADCRVGGAPLRGGGGVEWPCRVGEREGEGVLPRASSRARGRLLREREIDEMKNFVGNNGGRAHQRRRPRRSREENANW